VSSQSVEYRLGELAGEVKGLNVQVGKLTTAVERACTPASCPIGKDYSDFRSRIKGAVLVLGVAFTILTAVCVPIAIKVLL